MVPFQWRKMWRSALQLRRCDTVHKWVPLKWRRRDTMPCRVPCVHHCYVAAVLVKSAKSSPFLSFHASLPSCSPHCYSPFFPTIHYMIVWSWYAQYYKHLLCCSLYICDHHASLFSSLLPCVKWQQNTLLCKKEKKKRKSLRASERAREREREEGGKRRKCINPPQGSSERWAPPLSEVLGLSVTVPYLLPTHSLFALHKLQNCLCPWQP